MNITNLAAVRFAGLDVDSTVRVPEADGAVFAAAQAIVSVAVKTRGEDSAFVSTQHIGLLLRQTSNAHLFSKLTENPSGFQFSDVPNSREQIKKKIRGKINYKIARLEQKRRKKKRRNKRLFAILQSK